MAGPRVTPFTSSAERPGRSDEATWFCWAELPAALRRSVGGPESSFDADDVPGAGWYTAGRLLAPEFDESEVCELEPEPDDDEDPAPDDRCALSEGAEDCPLAEELSSGLERCRRGRSGSESPGVLSPLPEPEGELPAFIAAAFSSAVPFLFIVMVFEW